MERFAEQILKFQEFGTYTYKFDEGGNLIFCKNSMKFEEHFLSIPTINYKYDSDKITKFYSAEFSEFIPTRSEEIEMVETSNQDEINQLSEENQQLKQQLIVLTEKSDANITDAERMAIKDVIIELRIKLGQGLTETDFSENFPYLPITKIKR